MLGFLGETWTKRFEQQADQPRLGSGPTLVLMGTQESLLRAVDGKRGGS